MGGVRGLSSRRWAAVAVMVLLLLSACKNPDESSTQVVGATTTTLDGGVLVTTPTTVDPAQGALQRRDTPPEGVKEQLDFFAFYQGPEASCSELDGSRPAVVVSAPNAQVASSFAICLPGFVPNEPVNVEVRSPDGKVSRLTASEYTFPEEIAYTTWTTVPGDELGTYGITAAQGRRRGKGSFDLGLATSPRSVAIEPSTGPPGTTFRFGFAGFAEDSVVDVYLYQAEGKGSYTYRTVIPTAVDDIGQAVLSIPTGADDPPGQYCLIRRGAGAGPDYFCGLNFTVT